jgi:predicted nucleic acid-binding protein
MRVLLDTCVVSEVVRSAGAQRVKDRVAAFNRATTYLSVVTVGELARGVALLSPGKKREGLGAGLQRLEDDYGDRILPIDIETARIWGEIDALRQQQGRRLPALDGLIAATAIRHGLHVVTRNVSDFEATGALIINPWEDA